MHSRFVPDEALTREAVALAARLLQDAQHHMTRQEKRQAANAHHVHIVDVPVVHNGRLELRHYLREQTIAHTTHRYGNIMPPSR